MANPHPIVPPEFDNTGRKGPLHLAYKTFRAKLEASQTAFLAAYANTGNIREAAEAVGISSAAVAGWITDNKLDFVPKYRHAQREYANYLESLARKRVENPTFNGRIGSDVLMLGLLNANWPEKYRPKVVVQDETTVVSLVRELRALGAATRNALPVPEPAPSTESQALEAKVEGMLASRTRKVSVE